nr:MAG TPA: hypothetical protein [Caudoviricetes sp.]
MRALNHIPDLVASYETGVPLCETVTPVTPF